MTTTIAWKSVEDGTIAGYGIPFGGPLRGQDLTGTHFSVRTDLALPWFGPGERPVLYAHGFDPDLGTEVVGRVTAYRMDDDKGYWVEAQLDKAHKYWDAIKRLVDEGALSWSSGAVDHLTRVSTKTGEVLSWPWIEMSMVPNPANPDGTAIRYAVKAADAAAHLATIGVVAPEGVIDGDARPVDDATRSSLAAGDAAEAATIVGWLASILGREADEAAEASLIRHAIGDLTQYFNLEVATIGTPEDRAETAAAEVEAVEGWASTDTNAPGIVVVTGTGTNGHVAPVPSPTVPAVREGRRNSTADEAALVAAHDAVASVLGYDCMSAAAGKSLDRPPVAGLGIIPGTRTETPIDDEAFRALQRTIEDRAVQTARRLVG